MGKPGQWKEALLFWKKRSKKLLIPSGMLACDGQGHENLFRLKKKIFLPNKKRKIKLHAFAQPHGPKLPKVFWFFFSKKNCLPVSCLAFDQHDIIRLQLDCHGFP